MQNKRYALAVTGSAAMAKIVTMPVGVQSEKMKAQTQLDADKYIPCGLDEVNLDLEVLGSTEDSADTINDLLAISCVKRLICEAPRSGAWA